MPKVTTKMKAECKARLAEWLKDGDTLWFIFAGRSASGMQRRYKIKELIPDATLASKIATGDLTFNVAAACGYGYTEKHGDNELTINGCGFSAEQDIADSVSRLLGVKLRYERL